MKRYIRSTDTSNITKISVVVEIELPLKPQQVAAKTFDDKKLPKGELLPAEKDALINSQALADYHSFIESVEDLMTDYYELEIYYKNSSRSNSFYFGCIAKNSDGTPVIDFEANIRISTHDPHRSPQSAYNKKQQQKALKARVGGVKLKPIIKTIVVNKDEFNDYEEAYLAVDAIIGHVTKVMTRKQK